MKSKATLLVVLALASPFALSEPTSTADSGPKTKLEAFQAQTGTVMIKGYSEIGRINAMGVVSVKSMEFSNATTGSKQAGVLIEITESGRLENTDRSFIDYDEVDSLLKGIDYISKATPAVTKLGQFEATYKTKGHFSVTTFNGRDGKIDVAVKSGYIRPAKAYLSVEKLMELRELIVQAKQRLDSAK